MTFRAICVALLLASLPSTGCGTVANLANSLPEEGGTTPFGGVRKDVWRLKNAANGESGFKQLPGQTLLQVLAAQTVTSPTTPSLASATTQLLTVKRFQDAFALKPLHTKSEQYRQAAGKLFWAADLPLSAIGDVVTWPYTATYTYINEPTPTPPVTLAPTYPVTPATTEVRPQTSPLETLPKPRKTP
jgi:hypothetical protein